MHFQWYPGHMTKAKRMMQENIKLIDLIIELVDARVPLSSRNPDIDELGKNKARLIILNKSDLAEERWNEAWTEYFKKKGFHVVKVNSRKGGGVKSVQSVIQEACKAKIERDRKRGILNRPVRAMVVGIPNVGKSTLMNQLIGQKIAITSSKAQTTRNRIQTVYTSEEGQIVFLDTPGINKAKNKLGDYMLMAAERTLNEVDLILWLVEPTAFIGGGEQYIIEKLQNVKTPIFLVINKTDVATEEEILKAIVAYKDQCNFAEIIPVSALEGNNTDDLVHSIFKYLPEGPMYYDEDTITDQPERQIVAELVREKALRLLSQEIPHGIAVVIERMKTRKNGNIVDIEAVIVCERESHKRIIIGKKGAMIKEIGTQARVEMENLLDMKVNLRLWVKVRKDWRDSDILLKNYGYNKKEL